MKSRIKSMMLACVALTGAFFASCTDDALIEASDKYADRPFELIVDQTASNSRLALDPNGLTTKWEDDDQLVLVDKVGGKAPIFLACTELTNGGEKAKFTSESGVPSGNYYVICDNNYNNNESLAYGYKQFRSVEDINRNKDMVLWGELNVLPNTYSANVELEHLYAKIKVKLENVPTEMSMGMPMSGFTIGMYSSKKGFPVNLMFPKNNPQQSGPVNAEYGVDPNNLSNWHNDKTYFPSDRKYHNICLGSYSSEYQGWDDQNQTSIYDWSKAEGLSAFILPADLSNEVVFFYLLTNNTCYEIKKENGINFKAGTNYNVTLDLSEAKAVKTTLTESWNDMAMVTYQISTPTEWRHAAYRDGGYYGIMNDIDFENDYFLPINTERLEGNGYKLKNIELDWSNEDNVGLIKRDVSPNDMGDESNSVVSKLTLSNVTFKGKNCVGAFGGKNVFAQECSLIGESEIHGKDYVGGIVGRNNLYSYETQNMLKINVGDACKIYGQNYVGGVVGRYMEAGNNSFYLNSSLILMESCKSGATVTATGDYVGGIFGKVGGNRNSETTQINMNNSESDYTFSLIKCNNEGNVTGRNYVGGVGGDFAVSHYYTSVVDRVVLRESYSQGDVTGQQKVAGILGANQASVNTCYSTGTICASETEVGGVVGKMENNGMGGQNRIANCYSLATLSIGNTNGHIGGIVGNAGGGMYGGGNIIYCYYAADPNNNTFGGIVGNSNGGCIVTDCLTTLNNIGGPNWGDHFHTTGADYNGDGIADQDWNSDGVINSNDLLVNVPDVFTYTNPQNLVTDPTTNRVTSILANLEIINVDQKYSTNTWSGYPWECVKFANFDVDADSGDFKDEDVKP